jgi:hypothetical protein
VLRRWLPLLAVVALLAAAFVAAVYAEPQINVAPLPPPDGLDTTPAGVSGSPAPSPSDVAATEPPQRALLVLPAWINTVFMVGCLAVAVTIAAVLIWYVVRDTIQARGRPITVDSGPASGAAARAEAVAAAVDSGLADLSDLDADPRRAIIACWVRLERAAADAGTVRRPSDAPADYVARLLSAHRVSRPVLNRFAAVYRQARYGSAPVDETMRATALESLRQLRAELTVPIGQAP